jgi:uncharacterized protein YdiU (UPF0061 family)
MCGFLMTNNADRGTICSRYGFASDSGRPIGFEREITLPMQPVWNFHNTYLQLPETLFARRGPTPVANPRLIVFNEALAKRLGLNTQGVAQDTWARILAGNEVPPGAEPIAQAYCGHQYGSFARLGDGRALLLGEQIAQDGSRWDIQLKGSGLTPFSRRGDGRAALGPMLREYILSEAMFALGIPTSRSLAVVTTGEPVYRTTPLQGAVLTRVAASHIRIGTFEYLQTLGDLPTLKTLADYTVQRHFPSLADAPNPHQALLATVAERQAELIARWMAVGFIHGVMNTDNVGIAGETIDYGPCAFMDTYDPDTVFSSIDHHGRYAYQNQPRIGGWNLARFAEALLPLLHDEESRAIEMAQETLGKYGERYEHHWLAGMSAKLGLHTFEEDDRTLLQTWLGLLAQEKRDFTNAFRMLSSDSPQDQATISTGPFLDWHQRWTARLERQGTPIKAVHDRMRQKNPAFIPRNHRVEEALRAADEDGNYQPIQDLLQVLAAPFQDNPAWAAYQEPAGPEYSDYQTFCGT